MSLEESFVRLLLQVGFPSRSKRARSTTRLRQPKCAMKSVITVFSPENMSRKDFADRITDKNNKNLLLVDFFAT